MATVDLKAKADGIELTGLTPYSAKYTGYPIVKGTLSLDVHYLLDQGNLSADNHIFLDQLTFGDHVSDPNAKNLPVRLAVAILKNSRGEIDLHIPVSGSLSDPQFSLSQVIWAAFENLFIKAVTSPFALLGSVIGGLAGGSGEELSYVEFPPGLARITPESQKRLETLTTALTERPALKLSIAGRVDPKLDVSGLRQASLERQVKAQKAGSGVDPDTVQVKPDEYDKYLARAYSAAKFDKPRNFLGFAKTLPPEEMKKLILSNADVSEKALRQLADARANAVRRALSAKVEPVPAEEKGTGK
jgi:hypothetical protein